MKKISVIAVNYATKGLLEKFITNLLNSYENIEIILVDNDSPDGSADLVEKLFKDNPKVKLIRNSKNNGLSAGNNIGLENATGDYFLYLGTDAFPIKDVLESIVLYMDQNPDVGIVTPRLYLRDGKIDMDAHRGFPTPWVALTRMTSLDRLFPKSKLFNGYSRKYQDLTTRHEIDACISHFMFVNPKVHEKIGKWDEQFFLFGEDIDFCYRVKEAGFKIMYLGDLKVLHYKGASVNRNTSQDIDNIMNTDFDSITFKDKVIRSNNSKEIDSDEGSSNQGKKVSSTSLWMKIEIAKESSKAMRIFYIKHYVKKYPKIVNMLVLTGIRIKEQLRVGTVILKNFLKG